MKKRLLTALLCSAAIFNFSEKSSAQSTLIYYWNFNITDTSVHTPQYTASGAGSASFAYYGDMSTGYIDYANPGSFLNAQMSADSGGSLRLRVPADSVTFFMPTTNFHNAQFSFVVEKSGSGPVSDYVYYTTNGTTFIPACAASAADSCVFGVTTSYVLHTYNFGSDAATNNNPNFAVRISYGAAWSGAGNNRFDNVVLKADSGPTGITTINAYTKTTYSVYPNPTTDNLNINANRDGEKSVTVYNAVGRLVFEGKYSGKDFTINTSSLNTGVYMMNIIELADGTVTTKRFTKQ